MRGAWQSYWETFSCSAQPAPATGVDVDLEGTGTSQSVLRPAQGLPRPSSVWAFPNLEASLGSSGDLVVSRKPCDLV